jgi:hypothetical protein
MTDVSRPPMSSRQQPWSWAEGVSDAREAEQGIYEMGDGSLHAYVPPGTVTHQLGYEHVPLTRARSEANASDSNARNYYSFGASNQPSANNEAGI